MLAQTRTCDRGANAYCALEIVVVAPRYASSARLVSDEHAHLLHHGWTGANADTGNERAADSPGHELRVTYATAIDELTAMGLKWVKRTHATGLALSSTLVDGVSAMSVLLELGSS